MLNENKIKVAILGCGFFATNHIHSWKSFKDVVLAGVCDLDEQRAINASHLGNGTPYFTDAELMARCSSRSQTPAKTTSLKLFQEWI
jgi:predicted dehydrogenase